MSNKRTSQILSGNADRWQERWQLISRDLAEFIGEEEIKQMLKDGKDPKIYWGTATTGKPHLAYYTPVYKLADFLKAGCHVTVLFADLHGFLDNMKSTFELLEHRCRWYQAVIKQQLSSIDVPLDKLTFVQGTTFQLSPEYTLDMYKLAACCTTSHTKHAGAEVIKKSEHPPLSGLLYPILQALDEEYLKCDIQFGGVDQIKIFHFARENLPKIGYKSRCYLMNQMIPGLTETGKMSSSVPNSKIDLDDSPKAIRDKFAVAYSVDGQAEGNGPLAVMRYILFRFLEYKKRSFVVKRDAKWGGDMTFHDFPDLEQAFSERKLVSEDLKAAVAELVVEFLEPLRKFCSQNGELHNLAYPEFAYKQEPPPTMSGGYIDIRVGVVTSVADHPKQGKVLVLEVNVGEEAPRVVHCKLKGQVPEQIFGDARVLVVCNVAVKNGVTASILSAAVGTKQRTVKLPVIPESAAPGDRITWKDEHSEVKPDEPHISAKKLKKTLQLLKVGADGRILFKDENAAQVGGQDVTCDLEGASISNA